MQMVLDGATELEIQLFNREDLYTILYFDIKALVAEPPREGDQTLVMEPRGELLVNIIFGTTPQSQYRIATTILELTLVGSGTRPRGWVGTVQCRKATRSYGAFPLAAGPLAHLLTLACGEMGLGCEQINRRGAVKKRKVRPNLSPQTGRPAPHPPPHPIAPRPPLRPSQLPMAMVRFLGFKKTDEIVNNLQKESTMRKRETRQRVRAPHAV